jgi:hypothetical protein
MKKTLRQFFLELMDEDNDLFDEEIKDVSKDDWTVFAEMSSLLKPFKDATVGSSGEKITSLSIQVPWYDQLMTHLEQKRVFYFILIF